jgi:hypothetical protein
MKERVSQFPRSRLNTDPLLDRVPRNISAIAIELHCLSASQCRHEFLIGIRFCPTQLVIEMDNKQDDSQLAAKLQQKPQQSYRIDAAGNRHTNAFPGIQQLQPSDVGKDKFSQRVHRNMVPPRFM